MANHFIQWSLPSKPYHVTSTLWVSYDYYLYTINYSKAVSNIKKQIVLFVNSPQNHREHITEAINKQVYEFSPDCPPNHNWNDSIKWIVPITKLVFGLSQFHEWMRIKFHNVLQSMFILHANLLTCITVSVSACCILLRIALKIWSRFSPSSLPALEINVETNLPTNAAVNSEVRGSRSWLTTCITYHSPLWPCSSCHCAICSRATEMYARRHSPPFWTKQKYYQNSLFQFLAVKHHDFLRDKWWICMRKQINQL